MNDSLLKEFYPQIAQKGYTASEIRQDSRPVVKEVPEAFHDRFETYDEYLDHLHDFMNGI